MKSFAIGQLVVVKDGEEEGIVIDFQYHRQLATVELENRGAFWFEAHELRQYIAPDELNECLQ